VILKVLKPVAAVLALTLVVSQPCAYAGAIASKTAKNQELAALATDLALARNLFATDRIAGALAAEGLTPEQIDARLSALSTADLVSLGENPAQIRAAGISMSRRAWTIAGLVAGAVVVGALALESDDEEDNDESDDGED
jgi:hypothetical protein